MQPTVGLQQSTNWLRFRRLVSGSAVVITVAGVFGAARAQEHVSPAGDGTPSAADHQPAREGMAKEGSAVGDGSNTKSRDTDRGGGDDREGGFDGDRGDFDGDYGAVPRVNLTPAEMAKGAAGILREMDDSRTAVAKMLDKAREDRDVVKVLCLDDKASQMESARAAAGERSESLQDAVAAQDTELAVHAYTILLVLQDRFSQLSSEANQCIGVEAGFIADSEVTWGVDPGIPEEPTNFPANDLNSIPPDCVSCVL
ncbi:MAG: hypothetical protein FWD57_03945 [Polyangiaceae bacterium]|nr:hypothetical protein [Polyangiaceae bacterium]